MILDENEVVCFWVYNNNNAKALIPKGFSLHAYPLDHATISSEQLCFCLRLIFENDDLWLVCLRVHPTFSLQHPTESFVSFTAIDGTEHQIQPESIELSYEGDQRPNGEWKLVDKCLGVSLVNRFDIEEVYKCLIHWGTGTVNLDLWSEQRPVSKQSPLSISHEYEVIMNL